jgi:hypothetical protein
VPQEEYDQDLAEIESLLLPLILKCKEKDRAIRIGTPSSLSGLMRHVRQECNICSSN